MNNKYKVVIFWSKEDHSFIAEAPELPGYMAHRPSYSEVLENVQITINHWLETARSLGRSIPEPAKAQVKNG